MNKTNIKNNQRADRGKNRKAGNIEPSPEDIKQQLAKTYNIKPKTQEFIDNLLANPNKSIADVYMMNHKTTSRRNASIAGGKLLKKPAVIGYKDAAVGKAKRRIVQLVDSNNENISLKAAQDIIDRNEGKAVTKQEITQKTVSVKLDLQGLKLGAHYVRAE